MCFSLRIAVVYIVASLPLLVLQVHIKLLSGFTEVL